MNPSNGPSGSGILMRNKISNAFVNGKVSLAKLINPYGPRFYCKIQSLSHTTLS